MARDNIAQFPAAVWDGSSPSRPDATITERRPDAEDHEQVIAEVRAAQQMLLDTSILSMETAVNANAGTLPPGTPVYIKTDGEMDAADASAIATSGATVGLLTESVLTTAEGTYQFRDVLELTVAQWDAVGTDAAGLDPGVLYYVSETAGEITSTAPTGSSVVQKVVGIALSATKMLLLQSAPVELPA